MNYHKNEKSVTLQKPLFIMTAKTNFYAFAIMLCTTVALLSACASHKVTSNNIKTPAQLAAEQRYPDGAQPKPYVPLTANGQDVENPKIEPSSWWIGMKNPKVEILIHEQNVKNATVEIKYPGVKVVGQSSLENPNYLFVELEISPTTLPGDVIIFTKSGTKYSKFVLSLKERNRNRIAAQGLSPADFVYLLMPDRFSNGDPSNDSFDDMNQKGIDRSKMFFRHGGDLKGVMNHLDYLQDMGVTTLWLNPVLENNQPYESYHGYAITNHYEVDKRFGNNALYSEFVNECHKKGMKVMKDMIFNHVGSEHYLIKDLPSTDWVHITDTFMRTNYRDQVHYDPYASEYDKNLMLNGWFDKHMPDLNQKNPKLARYLIQNSIWWIEYAGIDAYRVDTYPYNDLDFMRNWSKAILDEYPNFYTCVESWVTGTPNQAFFTNNPLMQQTLGKNGIQPIDFQMHFAINEALTKPQGWTDGVMRIYHTLATDYLFASPQKHLTFLDNHDVSRAYSTFGENQEKLRSGIAWLLTMRGIPQLYYGTEILMKGVTNPDGYVRLDFPGGWKEDKSNKFTPKGRSRDENAMYDFVKKLANYRKTYPVLQTGNLMQFVPIDGVYTYFRYDDYKTVMVIMNTSDKAQKFYPKRFEERTKGSRTYKNILTDKNIDIENTTLAPFQTLIIECQK